MSWVQWHASVALVSERETIIPEVLFYPRVNLSRVRAQLARHRLGAPARLFLTGPPGHCSISSTISYVRVIGGNSKKKPPTSAIAAEEKTSSSCASGAFCEAIYVSELGGGYWPAGSAAALVPRRGYLHTESHIHVPPGGGHTTQQSQEHGGARRPKNPLDLCIIVTAGTRSVVFCRSRQCSPAERIAASNASRTPAPVLADASKYRMPSLCATPSPSTRVTLRSPSHFVPTNTRATPGHSRIA